MDHNISQYCDLKIAGGIASSNLLTLCYRQKMLIHTPESYDRDNDILNLQVSKIFVNMFFEYCLN